MEPSKLYIPNHKRWEAYYEKLLEKQKSKFDSKNILYKPDGFLVPSQTSSAQKVNKDSTSDPLSVKLISPVKQSNDQIVSELRREDDNPDIKGKLEEMRTKVHSKRGKKRSGKTLRSNKLKYKRKRIPKKRNKKGAKGKRRYKDIFTL